MNAGTLTLGVGSVGSVGSITSGALGKGTLSFEGGISIRGLLCERYLGHGRHNDQCHYGPVSLPGPITGTGTLSK